MRKLVLKLAVPAFLAAVAAGCHNDGATEPTRATALAVDDVTVPPEGMSFVTLAPGADLHDLVGTIERLHGSVYHVLAPRMLVAQLPAGAESALRDRGMVAHFERAVTDADLGRATVQEQRFARVFSNRFYPEAVDPDKAIERLYAPVPEGEPFETDALQAPAPMEVRAAAAPGVDAKAADLNAESYVYVPYASGAVVVSVWLPESNGVGEPSTEDWTENEIVAVYDKIQNALEAVKRHEPNSNLRFVMHYESSPTNGGLEGTIDHDWEFGKQANWGADNNEWRSVQEMLGRLVGPDAQDPMRQYLNGLRDQYTADGAFVVMVAANGNGTAGLRAHAYLNGPSTTLHSGNSWNVFLHEFGHIFGAMDEYCPDACVPPTATGGYLGVINGNATYEEGDGGGINNGRGEDQPSLMAANIENAVNGYTRGAWGWLDTDGDGIIEVRDTAPRSDVTVWVDQGQLRVGGEITDVPSAPLWRTPFSVNRISALQIRFADIEHSPWLTVDIDGRTRGRQQVDLSLGAVSGRHTVELRAVNSVGNVEAVPQSFVVEGPADNAAPFASLAVSPATGSPRTTFTMSVNVVDLEGQDVTVRFDTNGDGNFDTAPSASPEVSFQLTRPGAHVLRAEVRDAAGRTRIVEREVLVLDRNTPPNTRVESVSNPTNGSDHVQALFRAVEVDDVDGDAVELNWIQETVGPWGPENRIETGFGASTEFEALLQTPSDLSVHPIDLLEGNPRPMRDVLALGGDKLAVALGSEGIAIVDASNRRAPVVLSRLALETSAWNLAREGNLLYVLGGQLAVVNIANLAKPVELKQHWTERGSTEAVADWSLEIGPDGWATHYLDVPEDAKIERVKVIVDIDHEDASMLSIALETDKDIGAGQVQLLAAGEAPAGKKRFVFTPANTPALKALEGKFMRGSWSVQVKENRNVPEGEKPQSMGRLVRSELQIRTAHRAVQLQPGAHSLVGVVDGFYPVVAGHGIEVLDASMPRMTMQVAYLPGDYVTDAVLDGSTLFAGSRPEKRDGEGEQRSYGFGFGEPYTRGMYALDLRFPFWPEVVRMDESVNVQEIASVGSRLYAWAWDDVGDKGSEYTLVGDPAAFVGGNDWVLGQSDLAVRGDAIGDDQRVVALNGWGSVAELDVSDPAELQVLRSFERPWAERMTALEGGDLLLGQWMDNVVVNLDDTKSTTSRVFQITLQARDENGAVRTVSRNVHVVPYAHAPSISGVEVVRGHDANDEWEFLIHVDDVDQRPTWDPQLYGNVDLDGDGLVDSSWSQDYDLTGARVTTRFPAPGTYTLAFHARDGFWGVAPVTTLTVQVNAHTDVLCGGEHGNPCHPDEFCKIEGVNACGAELVGVCAPLWQWCEKPEEPTWVCGCDNQDYPDACYAHGNGINVASEGPCPVVECTSQTDCGENEFCSFKVDDEVPANSCGAVGPGTCEQRPDMCYPRFMGVCGCDGVTYRNECWAHQAGVSVSKYQPCEPLPPDCTVTGCEEGSVCVMCWGGNVCMPEGAHC